MTRKRTPGWAVAWILPVLMLIALAPGIQGQSIRDRTRPDVTRNTQVSDSQAVDLTLTLTAVSRRALQTWVRISGTADGSRTALRAVLNPADAVLVRAGQRLRAFAPRSISSAYETSVTRIVQGAETSIEAAIRFATGDTARHYVVEILVDRGRFLSIPNEAIIEEGESRIVYVAAGQGEFAPREIETGLRGELYTEVLSGLEEGQQVVTLGSFFIDAEHKLNSGS